MCEKKCGNCVHWHKLNVPKNKRDIYKNGKCGLGFHDADDTPTCRVFKCKGAVVPKTENAAYDPIREAAEITGAEIGRFTSNPWKEWLK